MISIPCHETKRFKHGPGKWCVLGWNHEGEHSFSEVIPIVLRYEDPFCAVSDDCANNLLDSLNDDAEGYKYSFDQVKGALWVMLENHIDRYLEELEYYFDQLSSGDQYRLLGDPEIDVKLEQRLEAGDMKYDEAHDEQ